MKLLLQIPLLVIILIIFNLIHFNNPESLQPGAPALFQLNLPSGGQWMATVSDLLIIGGILLLYLELFQSNPHQCGGDY